MRNLSTEFKEKQHNGKSDYLRFVTLNLKDGTILNLTNEQLWSEGFSFEDATSSTDSFAVGAAIVNSFTITLNNINDEFTGNNFEGATATCAVGFNLANENETSDRIEKIPVCTGTVVESPYQDTSIITLKCEDNMRKFDKNYSASQIAYPATRLQIIKDACDVCEVVLQTTSFNRDDYIVQEKPNDDNLTFRQVIAWASQLGGQYSRCDALGRLCVSWYAESFSRKDLSHYNFRAEPNLLRGTEDFSKGIVSGEIDSEKFNNLSVLKCNTPGNETLYVDVCQWKDFDILEPGTDYALSFYAKSSKDGIEIQSLLEKDCVAFINSNGNEIVSKDGLSKTKLSTEWERYSVLWYTSANTLGSKTLTPVRIPYNSQNEGETVYIAGVKFERNYENTEYIPNPVDFNSCALTDLTSITPNLESVVITGVRVTEFVDSSSTITNEDGSTTEIIAGKYLYGSEGYVLEISENKMIPIGTGETIASIIGEKIVGMNFTPFTGTCMTNLELEAGDSIVFTDRKGKTYKSYLTSVTMQPGSSQSVSNNAKSAERNSVEQYTLITKIYQEARNATVREKTQREKALEDLAKRLEDSDGVFTTVQETESGGKIYYLHNKQTLTDSDMIWKMTAEAWAVSTDGGKTWNAGMTVDGDVIARILTATGVSAEWINTGALTVRDSSGKIVFSVNMDTGRVIIDAEYIQIGGGNLTDKVNNLQGQIDGNIQTWTGTPTPSLDNYPANEWETDEEKDRHVGDVYYDENNHAYRFRNDGSGYEWQQLKDTDVTKALQDSSDALQNSEDALNAAALARNMTMQLDNDYQAIPVDSKGQYSTFPEVKTSPTVMYGSLDITDNCVYTIIKSNNIQGSWDFSQKTYTVTGLTADSGWVDVKATYLNNLSVTKRFMIVKLYAGETGKSGKGISGIPETTYQVSLNGDAIPTGAWQPSIPSVPAGQYLWTRTITNYTDGTSTTAYSISKIGTDGTNGTAGEVGKDGRGIINSSVSYQESVSGTVTPDGDWQVTIPSVAAGHYLWTKTTFFYSDNTTESAYSVSMMGQTGLQGIQGEKGDQGIPGKDGTNGTNGKTTYFHIKYAPVENPTSDQMKETPDIYIGTYVDFTETDSTDPTKYTWSRFQGIQGEKGDQGIPGIGEDGKTSYLHIAYANSEDGKTDFSVSDSENKSYIGQYTDFVETDSDEPNKYSWSKIRGNDGESARVYFIEPSANVIKRSRDNSIVPNEITFSAYYRDGITTARTSYLGRFVIEETSDGTTWTPLYTSSADENSVTHALYSILVDGSQKAIADDNGNAIGIARDVSAIRCKLYAAGGTTQLIDMQSVAVVVDIDNLTQTEIFNILTNNGLAKGVYMSGNELYVNASYLVTGILADKNKNNYWDLDQGTLVTKKAQIGDWQIADGVIYRNVIYNGIHYVVRFAPPSSDNAVGKYILSCQQYDDNVNKWIVNFAILGNGDAKFGENYIYANGTAKLGPLEIRDKTTAVFGCIILNTNGDAYFGTSYLNANGNAVFGESKINADGSANFKNTTISKEGKYTAGSTTINADGSCALGTNFKVDKSGNLTVGSSKINSDGSCALGTNFKVDKSGNLKVGSTEITSSGDISFKSELLISTDNGTPAYTAAKGNTLAVLTRSQLQLANTNTGKTTTITPSKVTTTDLSATGTKKRVVDTKNYATRSLYCYEMPSPAFGDIGEGILDEKGKCIIMIDDIFSETIVTDIEYQVFLQKEGQGDVWIEKKEDTYFEVAGTPGLKFAWELKARQKDFESERLEIFDNDSEFDDIDYESEAATMVSEFYSNLEVVL